MVFMKTAGNLALSERWNLAIALGGLFVFFATVVNGFTQGATDVLSSTGQPKNQVVATIPVGLIPSAVVVNPASNLVYVTNYGSKTVSVIYAATNTVATTIPVGNGAIVLAITPDGRTLYVANAPGIGEIIVSVIYTPTNTVTTTFNAGATEGTNINLAVSPDGAKVYLIPGGFNSGVVEFDTATNQYSGTIEINDPGFKATLPICVAFSSSGRFAYVISGAIKGNVSEPQTFLSKIDTVSQKQIRSTNLGAKGGGSWVSTHGHSVYVTNRYNDQGDIIVFDTNSNTVVKRIRFGTNGSDLAQTALTPDGKYLYVTFSNLNRVAVINTATDRLVGSPIQVGQFASAIAIAPDGLRAYVTNQLDNTVSVIDISTQ